MKRKVVTAVAIAAGLVGIAPAPAHASVPYACGSQVYCYFTYYSDASLTTEVGSRAIYCNHTVYSTGTITSYRVEEWEWC